jgi:hypothetical protein
MGWVVTLVQVGLAIWRATNGFKSYTGATLIAVASVGYYATCPRVVSADGFTLPAWMTPDLWVMLLGLGGSLAVAGLRSAIESFRRQLTPEAFALLVDIVRKAFEPYQTPVKPEPVPDVFPTTPYVNTGTFYGPVAFCDKTAAIMAQLRQAKSTEDDSGIVDLPKVVGSLLVLCCLAGAASAAAPKAIINGPVTGTAGELLTLDASGSQGDDVRYLWRVQPDLPGRVMYRTCGQDGSRINIASLPGVWQYTLVVSNAEGADLLTWTVTIPTAPQPAPLPIPPTPPAPGPTPAPPTPAPPSPSPVPPAPEPSPPAPPGPPESRFNLTRDIAAWAKDVPKAERESYAGICDAMAAEIVAVPKNFEGSNINEIAIKIAASLAKKIGTPRLGLIPVLMKLNSRLRELSPQLKSLDDWATVFREVSAGLRWGA